MSLIVSHPTGNPYVLQVLRGVMEAGLLSEYVTFFATMEGNSFDKFSKLPGFGDFERRRLDKIFRGKVAQRPWPELLRLFAQKFGLDFLIKHEEGLYCPDRNNKRLAAFAAERLRQSYSAVKSVYGFEDVALEVFQQARRAGLTTVYDLPIGYWRSARRILGEEAQRRPEWRSTMDTLRNSEAKLERKDEELRLADVVVVASTFTQSTLKDCPFSLPPVKVIPYGGNDAAIRREQFKETSPLSPLKVLFVGSLSQRKGIADLFEAMELVRGAAQLTVIGRKTGQHCAALEVSLAKHRWIETLPRKEILAEMSQHDVLVFPSLFEGFGLVVTEALSQGLPVITTFHTCGPDVLTEGEDGFIVPIRAPQEIAAKLELLHRDRKRLAEMSEAARKRSETWTWESYRKKVVEVVREVLGRGIG